MTTKRYYDRIEARYFHLMRTLDQAKPILTESTIEDFKASHNFFCPVYQASIGLITCLQRQRESNLGHVGYNYGTSKNRGQDFKHCIDCPLGKRILAALDLGLPIAEIQKMILLAQSELNLQPRTLLYHESTYNRIATTNPINYTNTMRKPPLS